VTGDTVRRRARRRNTSPALSASTGLLAFYPDGW